MYFRCPHCKAFERVRGGVFGNVWLCDADVVAVTCLECNEHSSAPDFFLTEDLMIAHYKKLTSGRSKQVRT
jgi:hypothetical protein